MVVFKFYFFNLVLYGFGGLPVSWSLDKQSTFSESHGINGGLFFRSDSLVV